MISNNGGGQSAGKLFEYVNNELDFDDMKFTIMLNGAIYEGELDPNKEYELLVFIKDGGEFDLDKLVNGAVIASIFLANEKEEGRRGGGCNSAPGFGSLLAMLLFTAANRRGRRP